MIERLVGPFGAVRDGFASIDGFAQLLSSPRVGAQGVVRALPTVREACSTLQTSLSLLMSAFSAELMAYPEGERVMQDLINAANALATTLEHDLSAVEAAIQARASARAPFDARGRLALEALVRRASQRFERIFRLLELLTMALERRSTPLALAGILQQKNTETVQRPQTSHVTVTYDPTSTLTFMSDARVIGGLIDIAVGTVAATGVSNLHLDASRTPQERVELRISAARTSGSETWCSMRLIPHHVDDQARAVAHVVATLAGIILTFDAEQQNVSLVI